MVHGEFFKIVLGIFIALLFGVGIGAAFYFFGKNESDEMPVVSVQDEGGFPQAGERTLKPYQYPKAKPRSYPQPEQKSSPPPSLSVPTVQVAKPLSKGLVVFPKIVYPQDYQPDEGTSEEGYNPDADSEGETD